MTKQTLLEMAIDLVIMDAIAKGHTNIAGLTAYMQSDVFNNAVAGYVDLMKEQF